jgi:hypothetical protein
MVNGRFPEPGGYGFEMVDAPGARCFRKAGINRKFTPNPIARIFREFSLI